MGTCMHRLDYAALRRHGLKFSLLSLFLLILVMLVTPKFHSHRRMPELKEQQISRMARRSFNRRRLGHEICLSLNGIRLNDISDDRLNTLIKKYPKSDALLDAVTYETPQHDVADILKVLQEHKKLRSEHKHPKAKVEAVDEYEPTAADWKEKVQQLKMKEKVQELEETIKEMKEENRQEEFTDYLETRQEYVQEFAEKNKEYFQELAEKRKEMIEQEEKFHQDDTDLFEPQIVGKRIELLKKSKRSKAFKAAWLEEAWAQEFSCNKKVRFDWLISQGFLQLREEALGPNHLLVTFNSDKCKKENKNSYYQSIMQEAFFTEKDAFKPGDQYSAEDADKIQMMKWKTQNYGEYFLVAINKTDYSIDGYLNCTRCKEPKPENINKEWFEDPKGAGRVYYENILDNEWEITCKICTCKEVSQADKTCPYCDTNEAGWKKEGPISQHARNGSVLIILTFAASPRSRGTGISTKLLDWILKYGGTGGKDEGIKYISGFCNSKGLKRYYTKMMNRHGVTIITFPKEMVTLWPGECKAENSNHTSLSVCLANGCGKWKNTPEDAEPWYLIFGEFNAPPAVQKPNVCPQLTTPQRRLERLTGQLDKLR